MQDKNRMGLKRKYSMAGEVYYAYIPKPLPPKPSLGLDKLFPLF